MDSVSRLASAAAERIAGGALNARPVASLAADLHVSERHLRRALQREAGVTPVELAQTHRLLMAKRLLADTSLDMSQIAYASGFRSLRRFNAAVRERYGIPPTHLRRASRRRSDDGRTRAGPRRDVLALTLSYRPPIAWNAILEFLARNATPGIEVVDEWRYGRTVRIGDSCGVIFAEVNVARAAVNVEVSATLVPVLMPLLAGLRRLFDLDADPSVIDAHLRETGLADLVSERPGIRVPGAIDGFEAAFLALLHDAPGGADLAARVVCNLGARIDTETPGLDRITPDPARVAEAGEQRLAALGASPGLARSIVSLARAVATRSLRLDPGEDADETFRRLVEIYHVGEHAATMIVMRALCWPDAFPTCDAAPMQAGDPPTLDDLAERVEAWRPWRAYAAMHLCTRSPEHHRQRRR
jgi:AraC family transcriptional regulator, regulatory protein of adaptative response / DNA-3-methyladenine glycosylase II